MSTTNRGFKRRECTGRPGVVSVPWSAETGYYGFFSAYKRRQVMPGLVQGIGKMMQDEARHIAFGVYFLSRLITEHGDPV